MSISFTSLKECHLSGVINLVSTISNYKPQESEYKKIWKHFSLQNNVFAIVALDEKKVVGFGYICTNMTIRGGKIAYIEDVICDVNFRSKGLGKEIMNHLLDYAKKNNCYKIVLQCIKNNVIFYKKCGYRVNGSAMQILM